MVAVDPPFDIVRRRDSREPQVKMRKIMVINTRTIVDIGEKRRRYLMRRYHTAPSTAERRTTKWDERLMGAASMNTEASNPLGFRWGEVDVPSCL